MYIDLSGYLTFLLVMLRVTGLLIFNPILGRRNVPLRINLGLAFFLALLLSAAVEPPPSQDITLLAFVQYGVMELLVGIAAGFIMHMFLSVLIIGGDMIDMNLGVAMAKAFDPGSNASISITTSFLNVLYILIFFATNNHLTLIRLLRQTYSIIPPGFTHISEEALYYIPVLMSSIFVYAIKLCLPLVILEVVMTMGVGMIMRVVPQINVFVVNIQVKLFVGLFTLFVLVPAFTGFVENMITICFERIAEVWLLMPK